MSKKSLKKQVIGGIAWRGSADIVQKVLQNDSNGAYFIVEPNIKEHNVFKLTDYKNAVQEADIIVFLVAHDEFKDLEISLDKVVLDFCGITSRDNKKLNGI